MGTDHQDFVFTAELTELDEGLDILHRSIQRLREATRRTQDDRALMLFETALGEIGSNVLTHGRPPGIERPVEYTLRLDGGTLVASLSDSGLPVHEHLSQEMTAHESETGGGLAMERPVVHALGDA